jgi:hypothetical protein
MCTFDDEICYSRYVRMELLPRIRDDILPIYHNFLRSELTPFIQITNQQVVDIKQCLFLLFKLYSGQEYMERYFKLSNSIDMNEMFTYFECFEKIIHILQPIISKQTLPTTIKKRISDQFTDTKSINSILKDFLITTLK